MSKLKVFGSGDKASLFYNWYFFAILASGLFIVLSLAGNSTISGILAFLSLGVSARIAYLDKKNADSKVRYRYVDYRVFSKVEMEKRLNQCAYSLVAFIINLLCSCQCCSLGLALTSPVCLNVLYGIVYMRIPTVLLLHGCYGNNQFPTSHGDTAKHDISPTGDTKAVVDTVAEKVDSAVEEVKDDFEGIENDVETTDTDVEGLRPT